MRVSAIIVTRGNVDLAPVLDSLPKEWERVVWDNSSADSAQEALSKAARGSAFNGSVGIWLVGMGDLSVYGRYAAIEYASHDLIYVQDDDVIVSDPQAIVKAYDGKAAWKWLAGNPKPSPHVPYDDFLVANMPQEFRHDGYTDSCLVGFGACFHRDLPKRAFARFMDYHEHMIPLGIRQDVFWRTCDVVFTTLTPRVLVDVPKQNLDYAYGLDRMWRQPDHVGERARMLELARRVRDGG